MATTEPLTGVTVQDQSDAATGGQQVGNVAKTLARFTVPRFASTAARDTAYSAMVSGGGTMADGMLCSAAGVPYRRIGGAWRINRPRVISRTAVLGSSSGAILAGGSAETGATTGATLTGGGTFVVYETSTYQVSASFRAGPNSTGAALCSVKINGAAVGNVAVSRDDGTVSVTASIALAAGTHTIALRVDTNGGAVTWTDGIVTLTEGTAE